MKPTFLFLIISIFYTHNQFSQSLEVNSFVSGLDRPVVITNAGDDRLFIAEQTGKIQIINSDGTLRNTPFIDLTSRISTNHSERGLLGLAFHPDYSTNGYFFVYYTDTSGDSVIDRYRVNSTDNNIADVSSRLEILSFNQTDLNHNGGHLAFGPDGMLYIGSGDGGGANDRPNNAQNRSLLLGKLLRLDIDKSAPYIPSDNPFVGRDGADEIWAYGLRNPWKFSFDFETNDLWIADVGQGSFEEINKVSANTSELNYGWRCFEGNEEFNQANCSTNNQDFIFPVNEYAHSSGRCSITGGYVYRGSEYPSLRGWYIFADYCSGELGYVNNDGAEMSFFNVVEPFTLGAFGEDINKELYVADTENGIIYTVELNGILSNPDLEKEIFQLTIKNPVEEELVIQNTNDIDEIIIFDLQGKELISEKNNAEKNIKITTDHLSNGIYLLWAENKKGEKTNLKFIKQ